MNIQRIKNVLSKIMAIIICIIAFLVFITGIIFISIHYKNSPWFMIYLLAAILLLLLVAILYGAFELWDN